MEQSVRAEQQSVLTVTLTNVQVQAVHTVLLSRTSDSRPAPVPYEDVTLPADKYRIQRGTVRSDIDCVKRTAG